MSYGRRCRICRHRCEATESQDLSVAYRYRTFVLVLPRQVGNKRVSALNCSLSLRQPTFNKGGLLKTAGHFFQPKR
jgi:hypothetical protein